MRASAIAGGKHNGLSPAASSPMATGGRAMRLLLQARPGPMRRRIDPNVTGSLQDLQRGGKWTKALCRPGSSQAAVFWDMTFSEMRKRAISGQCIGFRRIRHADRCKSTREK